MTVLRTLLFFSLFSVAGAAATSHRAFAGKIFAFPHLLPSPFTLPAGQLSYGTEVALGITDFFQVGTNILRDAYRIFNANARLCMIDLPAFAFSPFVSFESFNYRHIDSSNPDLRVTSWMPGAVAAFEISQTFALFTGGNVNITKTPLIEQNLTTSALLKGATIQSDLAWAYQAVGYGAAAPKKIKSTEDIEPDRLPKPIRGKHLGNVLSGGVSYDLNYKLFGLGISHHWQGFHLGVHYYPKASKFPLQPIVSGGGSLDL
ncbi:MAG TPA: hypothetical protein PLH57_11000 [Oligoflexia bacterium]|nr:hypothetical protein [Oligoflexia bacterium]